MERIEELFPSYTDADRALVKAAYDIACKELEDKKRGNGAPFIEHAENVARIAADEIGLGPECVAAVFLHEATRGRAESGIIPAGVFGRDILTIEGLEKNGELDRIQKAFVEHAAVQCGFCTPGMIMSAYALLQDNPNPTEDEVRRAISGNICRCTGYQQIVDAVLSLNM